MRTIRSRSLSFIMSLMMVLTLAAFVPDVMLGASADTYPNYFNKQDDCEVPYNGSYWIQPPAWNCPTVNPRNYEGGIMIFFDKIGLYPENAHGKIQRIYVSVHGATDPVSMMKFHVFYDTRLKVVNNSNGDPVNPGKAVVDFDTGSAMVEEGQIAFYAYSKTDIELGNASLFTIDFQIPDDAEPGDFYPIGMSYVDDGIVADTFIDSKCTEEGKLQMTYVFSKGIYNGYLYMMGEPKRKKADLTLRIPREGVKYDTDPKAWFGKTPDDIVISDLEWTERNSLSDFGEGDTFKAGKVYGLMFKVTPAGGRTFSKKFEVTVNGKKAVYQGSDITNGGMFVTDIEALDKLRGDINNDGLVNITDISLLSAHIKGRKMLSDLNIADFNSDSKIDVTDLSKLAAHIKGKRSLG